MDKSPLMAQTTGVQAYEKMMVADMLRGALASVPDEVIHPAYNTDDAYIYIEDTGEIVEQVGNATIRCGELLRGIENMPVGFAVCSGFKAYALRLWARPFQGTRLICSDRQRELRFMFSTAQRSTK
jgi:hypothetical protein